MMNRSSGGELRTSYRVQGADAVDEFRALCFLFGRQPHQLVAELVSDQLARLFGDNPGLADDVAQLVGIARNRRRELDIRDLNALWSAEPANHQIPSNRSPRRA